MLTLENARRVDEDKAALADSLGGLAQAAVHDPAMAPGVTGRGFAQIESAMKAGMLAPEEAAAMQGAFAENVHMSAMRGQIATAPEDMQTRLVAGEFDDIFDAAARDRLIGEARTTARLKTAGASAAARAKRRGLEIDMADHLAALDETGLADEAVAARAQAELPETEHAAFQASQAQARERHATRAEYAFMTPAEIEADIAQRAEGGPANIDRRNGDQRAADHATRLAIRDEVLTARATDPAGWAMRDDAVAAAYQAAQENPDNPALARHASQQRIALQREMGIAQPRLLSDAERDEIAGQLAHAAPADRPALIADLRARYGPQANMLAAELTGEVDANTALLIAHADMPQLPRLLAQGMEKAKKDGPAKLTLANPEALNDLPALPLVGTGVPGGRKLDMAVLKPGQHYRTSDGGVLRYDGEALVPMTVESAAPNPADPNTPTPPLPLGKAGSVGGGRWRFTVPDEADSSPLVRAGYDVADEQGNPQALDVGADIADDFEAAILTPSTGLEDDEASPQADQAEQAEDESGSVSAEPSLDESQRNKTEAMTSWVKLATFGKNVPGGWKEMPKLPDGTIDRRALAIGQVYHVIGADGGRSAWRWNEKKRAFMPFRGKAVTFSLDGMHELIGVSAKRAPDGRPIYNMEQDRVNAINWGIDAVFQITDNPDADDSDRIQDLATSSYAKATVFENTETIERLAGEYSIDPQLVKAIMYREQAAGPVQPAADSLGISDTLSPMGFNPDVWNGLGIDREAASNSEDNIRAAVILISSIQDRITDPTPEKVATLYNGLMKEKVSDYGALVGRYYKESPWLREADDPQP